MGGGGGKGEETREQNRKGEERVSRCFPHPFGLGGCGFRGGKEVFFTCGHGFMCHKKKIQLRKERQRAGREPSSYKKGLLHLQGSLSLKATSSRRNIS